jgi:hypothetical protein
MFKKGILTLFVVTLGVFAFGLAHADQIDALGSGEIGQIQPPTTVYVNPGGLGDALIYGYYNVRDNRDNYFNVVNTDTSNGVRARIRFIEAADIVDDECGGSKEILDFDICLTPGDVWTGVIKATNDVGTLFSPDDDTYVDIGETRGINSVIFADSFPGGVAFRTDPVVEGVTAGMTMEGYFIVIAEEGLTEVLSDGNCGPNLRDNNRQVENVLFGLNYAVDMDNLETYANNAVALGDFSSIPFKTNPVDASPNLASAVPGGLTAVNFALTKSNHYATYDLESAIGGKTELIVNFPTRRLTCLAQIPIFDDDSVLVTIWDDEENSPKSVCEFSPCPEGVDVDLPYEVNVIDLNNSDIFTSMVEVPLSVSFEYGWINIDLVNSVTESPVLPLHRTIVIPQTSWGLPSLGYVAYSIANGGSTHLVPTQYSADVDCDHIRDQCAIGAE